jgi:hypothetical protein
MGLLEYILRLNVKVIHLKMVTPTQNKRGILSRTLLKPQTLGQINLKHFLLNFWFHSTKLLALSVNLVYLRQFFISRLLAN